MLGGLCLRHPCPVFHVALSMRSWRLVLVPLNVALTLFNMAKLTGRDKPTVIT